MKSIYLSFVIFFTCITLITAQECEKVSNLSIDDDLVVTWNPVEDAKSYNFEYRESGTFAWESVNTTESSFAFEPPMPCSKYEIRVITICNDETKSESSDFITTDGDCDVCQLDTYCAVSQSNSSEYLDYFKIDGQEFNSGQNANSYVQNLSTTLEFAAGEDYTIEMAPGFTDFEFNQVLGLFIDLNGNGNFEIDEALFISEPTIEPVQGTITIPDDVPSGSVRLRAICSYSFLEDPCSPSTFGETEDYCVSLESKCDADFEFEFTGLSGEAANFQWKKLEDMFAFNYRYKKVAEEEWEYGTSIQEVLKLEDLDQCTKYEIELRSVCPFDTSSYRSNIQFDSYCPTALQEIENLEFNVYPNPWASELSIELDFDKSTEARVVAYDVLGKAYELVPFQYFSAGKRIITIDEYQTQGMTNGLYIISVETVDEKIATRKALKL